MEFIPETFRSIRSAGAMEIAAQFVSIGRILGAVLIAWKLIIFISGSESPAVVVLSGSMEPGFKRGDILFLYMDDKPVRAGEIVVFNVKGRPIPIVHRVIKVHEHLNTDKSDILTKGDHNPGDDKVLYARGQLWLHEHDIMGKAIGFVPYLGWLTIIMTEMPLIKYLLFGALGLFIIISKEKR